MKRLAIIALFLAFCISTEPAHAEPDYVEVETPAEIEEMPTADAEAEAFCTEDEAVCTEGFDEYTEPADTELGPAYIARKAAQNGPLPGLQQTDKHGARKHMRVRGCKRSNLSRTLPARNRPGRRTHHRADKNRASHRANICRSVRPRRNGKGQR